MLRFCFLTLCSVIAATNLVQAESSVIKSTTAIRDIPVMRKNDTARYSPALCAEYLALQPNSHHRYQPGVGSEGESIKKADIDAIDLLGSSTHMQLQPAPATQSKTIKTTETATSGTVTTTTETVRNQNAATVASATPIAVRIDHKSGLMRINGKIVSEFDKRQLQEACQSAIQR